MSLLNRIMALENRNARGMPPVISVVPHTDENGNHSIQYGSPDIWCKGTTCVVAHETNLSILDMLGKLHFDLVGEIEAYKKKYGT